jgi:hypothetical protein
LKLKLITALSALPLAAAAHAANVYSFCEYENSDNGKRPFTQLFTLEGDALKDGYGAFSFDKTREWEAQVPVDKSTTALRIGGYRADSLVGQFKTFAGKDAQSADCYVTTDKERAFAWYRSRLADARYDKFTIEDWRPSAEAFLEVEQWPPN